MSTVFTFYIAWPTSPLHIRPPLCLSVYHCDLHLVVSTWAREGGQKSLCTAIRIRTFWRLLSEARGPARFVWPEHRRVIDLQTLNMQWEVLHFIFQIEEIWTDSVEWNVFTVFHWSLTNKIQGLRFLVWTCTETPDLLIAQIETYVCNDLPLVSIESFRMGLS